VSAEDADEIRALAYEALRSQLSNGTGAEAARQEGIKLGAQMAADAATENKSAEVWDRVLSRAEGMLDKFLDRMEAQELRKAAAATPAPVASKGDDERDQAQELDAAAVLAAIGKRPPPTEAAELLAGAGVTSENLDEVLAHVREAGQGWGTFLDEQPEWLASVRAELAAEGPSE
jgi:hypothetical protein